MSAGPRITVHRQSNCVQCIATYRALDNLDVDYTVVDNSEDADTRGCVMSLGHLQAPVVIVDGEYDDATAAALLGHSGTATTIRAYVQRSHRAPRSAWRPGGRGVHLRVCGA